MRAQPYIGARRNFGGCHISAASSFASPSEDARECLADNAFPVIDRSQQHRSHPDRHLFEQPPGLLARDRTSGALG